MYSGVVLAVPFFSAGLSKPQFTLQFTFKKSYTRGQQLCDLVIQYFVTHWHVTLTISFMVQLCQILHLPLTCYGGNVILIQF